MPDASVGYELYGQSCDAKAAHVEAKKALAHAENHEALDADYDHPAVVSAISETAARGLHFISLANRATNDFAAGGGPETNDSALLSRFDLLFIILDIRLQQR